jgi:hypothetical protein
MQCNSRVQVVGKRCKFVSQAWREDCVESTESLVFSTSGKRLVIAVAIEYRSQEIRAFKKAFSSFQK